MRPNFRLWRLLAWTLPVFAACGPVDESAPEEKLRLYEGFHYPAGTALTGQAGGKGFYGAWLMGGFNVSGAGDYRIGEGSLEYPGLAATGNRLVCEASGAMQGVRRELLSDFKRPAGPRYLSVLLRPEAARAGGATGYFGLVLGSGQDLEVFFGQAGPRGTLEFVLEYRGGRDRQLTGVTPAIGQTMLLVLRAEFAAGPETYTLYVNPGETEPATGAKLATPHLSQPYLMIYSTGSFSLDEIRVGDTYAEVAPRLRPWWKLW